MKNLSLIVACLTLIAAHFPTHAATHLSDKLTGKTLTPSGNPYIIDQDVVIPKNQQVIIKAGCIFLFKSFTGITVTGSIIVEGTEDNPIVFTSINDSKYNSGATQLPNAFDWNGIYIANESGDCKFRNFKLMYSVFGIKSKKDDITIQNGHFKQNGQFHFTINDNIHYVQDNISYSYNTQEKSETPAKKQTEKASLEKKQKKKKDRAKGGKPKIAAYALMGVSVTLGVTCLITGIKAGQNRELSESAVSQKEYDTYSDKFNRSRAASVITGVTCGITLPLSIPLSIFLFTRREKSAMKKKVSLNITGGVDRFGVGIIKYY